MSDIAMQPSPNCETSGPFIPSCMVFKLAVPFVYGGKLFHHTLRHSWTEIQNERILPATIFRGSRFGYWVPSLRGLHGWGFSYRWFTHFPVVFNQNPHVLKGAKGAASADFGHPGHSF